MFLFERSSPGKGPRLISDIRVSVSAVMDFAQLKEGLSKSFASIRNKKETQQRRDLEPTNFVNDLLKPLGRLKLGMSEDTVVDHIFVRLKPQVQDYMGCEIHKTRIYYGCIINV
ncbi:uncharacterized protein TNCV_1637101 [Trichonephila clavipes]|nr:uncharacterized protein TNCV_1637101 [Trichonephila clavipes]